MRRWKRADISDAQAVAAALLSHGKVAQWWPGMPFGPCTLDVLIYATGAPRKVATAAMERAYRRGLIDYGVSLRTAWATPSGGQLLAPSMEELDALTSITTASAPPSVVAVWG